MSSGYRPQKFRRIYVLEMTEAVTHRKLWNRFFSKAKPTRFAGLQQVAHLGSTVIISTSPHSGLLLLILHYYFSSLFLSVFNAMFISFSFKVELQNWYFIIIISGKKMPFHHPIIRLHYDRRGAFSFILAYCCKYLGCFCWWYRVFIV